MPGTVNVTTISDHSAHEISVDNLLEGFAKAWMVWDGTGTAAISASFNHTSLTDIGTGEYTSNFTNVLASVDYITSGAGVDTGLGADMWHGRKAAGTKTTSACDITTFASGGFADRADNGVEYNGTL